jgi:hypothetical protein
MLQQCGGASLFTEFKWWIKLRKLVYEWVQENQTKIISNAILCQSSQSNQPFLEQNPEDFTPLEQN